MTFAARTSAGSRSTTSRAVSPVAAARSALAAARVIEPDARLTGADVASSVGSASPISSNAAAPRCRARIRLSSREPRGGATTILS